MQERYSIDLVRDVLREATGPDGEFSQRGLSAKAGLGRDTVGDIINGRNKNPSVTTLEAIAGAMEKDVSIFGLATSSNIVPVGPQIPLIASVAAGLWQVAWQWPEDDWKWVTSPLNVPIPISERFYLRPDGDSMNLAYPAGTLIECRKYYHDHVIPSGKRVIVQRQRTDGEYETTVKELVRDPEGIEWLVPRSTNPSFQPFRADQQESDIAICEIIAIVIGSYRPED